MCRLQTVCSAPSIDAQPTGPTIAAITITPPAGGPWASYTVTLCPADGATCVTASCTNPASCVAPGLTPSTTYTVTVGGVSAAAVPGLTKSCYRQSHAVDSLLFLLAQLKGDGQFVPVLQPSAVRYRRGAHSITDGAGCGRQTWHNQPSLRSRHIHHLACSSTHADQRASHQPHCRHRHRHPTSWRDIHQVHIHGCASQRRRVPHYSEQQQPYCCHPRLDAWHTGTHVLPNALNGSV